MPIAYLFRYKSPQPLAVKLKTTISNCLSPQANPQPCRIYHFCQSSARLALVFFAHYTIFLDHQRVPEIFFRPRFVELQHFWSFFVFSSFQHFRADSITTAGVQTQQTLLLFTREEKASKVCVRKQGSEEECGKRCGERLYDDERGGGHAPTETYYCTDSKWLLERSF